MILKKVNKQLIGYLIYLMKMSDDLMCQMFCVTRGVDTIK